MRRVGYLRRFWPRTLFGRVALIVVTGVLVSHLVTLAIVWRERGERSLAMMSAYVGRDVGASVALLDRLPASERAEWLPRLARPQYRYALGAPAAGADIGADDDPVPAALGQAIAAGLGRDATAGWRATPDGELALPLVLADGTPLTFLLAAMRPAMDAGWIALLVLQLAVLIAATWIAVRMAVRPLARLSDAARRLEPAQGARALAEAGPEEVAQAARAFNAMQQRIATHLADRMRMLAAIAHDLQTPITRARLRSEAVADPALRDKLQADLTAMQSLVEEGLAYARTAQARQEEPRPVDLAALLDGIVCDAQDSGHAVTLHLPQDLTPVATRVQALRRIVGNLLDNAIKFSGAPVDVRVERDEEGLRIAVLDRGPGIAGSELEAVLQPFYRVESSRNRDTGGTGLGLAIASELAAALPGRLVLCNRDGGGLEARVELACWRGKHSGSTLVGSLDG